MSEPRNEVVYVTQDGAEVLYLNVPHGMISPPTIQLHLPLVGSITFYTASGYGLPVPKDLR